MKTRILLLVVSVLVLGAGGLIFMRARENSSRQIGSASAVSPPAVSHSDAAHSHSQRVPSYQSAAEARHLPPTLPPGQFVGKARAAYEAAKEIPQTLAQLPCYCECDQSIGHKSLQTCFVDDHASHCAVCVDEALLAYKLQKEDKKTPEQVRDLIIEKYSAATHH
jgi:hypothetical protein